MKKHALSLTIAVLLMLGASFAQAVTVTIDFEELPLVGEDFYNGSDEEGGFTSYGTMFNNLYTDFGSGCCWNGWAYSQTTDPNTPGPGNQYSAYAGGGANGSAKYGVAFSGLDAGGGIVPEISLPAGAEPASVLITNTTYSALSMLHGDTFAKKFGGLSGNDPDWFLLTVEGYNDANNFVGSVPFYLADYRFTDPNEDYLLEDWTEVDLAALSGLGVSRLDFRLSSSDTHPSFGMNTPAYVAIDDLVLEVAATSGDFDLNGIVDSQDLNIWQTHYGTTSGATFTSGDADEDGYVGGLDFLLWQQGVALPVGTLNVVPEPAGFFLASSWLILAGGRFRRTSP